MRELGLYEQLINKALAEINDSDIQVEKKDLDENNSAKVLSKYFSSVLEKGLLDLKEKGYNTHEQLKFCNFLIEEVKEKTSDDFYETQKVDENGQILYSLIEKKDNIQALNTIYPERPFYSIAEPFLFTGASTDIQLLSELKKEIESCDEIDFIVSFIKWSGIRVLLDELSTFTKKGGKLRIITTTYTGATEAKAVLRLSELCNTEIKISYDTKSTRLHAKSYIFKRKTGFSTAYVGSSNISKVAMTDGTEWNVKVTEKEMLDVYKKIKETFEIYWNNEEFELFKIEDKEKLIKCLKKEKQLSLSDVNPYILDYTPFPFQEKVLNKLEAERLNFGNYKNLIVAATGTGKTVISAFDFKNFLSKNKNAKILFIAHRKELLEQALKTYRAILKDHNFGELMVDGINPTSFENLFASIQTFNSKKMYEKLSPNFYDFIVVDEFHHAAAESYQKLLSHFHPKILLGLTATPERMDGKDILKYFNNKISAEIRLPEAIEKRLLVPFSYFGVSDDTDLSQVKWSRGGYDLNELENVLTFNKARTLMIINSLDKYLNDLDEVKALGFCVSKKHADYMAKSFNESGIPSISLNSDSTKEERETAKQKLIKGEIKFVFVVDLYNEGVDIPEVNTILFLRPTESLTVFLQQLGRGLRLCDGKDCLTVLDYVGQANKRYNYADKFEALLGTNAMSVTNEIKYGFPNLPRGCFISLEKKAMEYVLDNIKQSFNNKNRLIESYSEFVQQNGKVPNFEEFLNFCNITPEKLYKLGLTFTALKTKNYEGELKFTNFLFRATKISSPALIKTLKKLLPKIKNGEISSINEYEKRSLLMLYYTFEPNKSPKMCGKENVIEAVKDITNSRYYSELIDLLSYNFSKIDTLSFPLLNDGLCPLQLYSSYSSIQIMAALGVYDEEKYFPLTAGVFYFKEQKIDIFFVTLNKSEKEYTPNVRYEDFSINDKLFHWQSQNNTDVNSETGKRYINQRKTGSKILLCVRNNKKDECGATEDYTILGFCNYVSHEGSRPISFVLELEHKIPAKFIEKTSKLMIN